VECNRDGIICGSVKAVCKLEWVLGFWDDGVDVSHDTSLSKHFMATDVCITGWSSFRQVTLVFLGTGTMVVCLKHVGITDADRERLKMSVKTLAS
jgi:hypothetical protein